MAFLSKFLTGLAMAILEKIFRAVWDHVSAWIERRRKSAEQKRKDQASKKPYDDVIQNGSNDEIIRQTEDRFNS